MDCSDLGKSGIRVSAIGMGMWQASGAIWGTDVTDESCIQAVVRSSELGVNLVDTAEAYGDGHSEEVLGKAIKRVDREKLIVATKVNGSHLRYDDVLKACEMSLRRLGIKQVDLYQVHWPDPWQQIPLKHTMKAMEKLYDEGKIRAVGVSNFAVRDLEEARSILSHAEIVSDQVRYNLINRQIEEEVLPYCSREKITILAYVPLAQGALTGKYSEDLKPTDQVRKDNQAFSDHNLREIAGLLKVLQGMANKRGKTVAQVALNWILSHPGVIPIPGAKNAEQAEQNAGAAGWSLTQDEMREVTAAADTTELDYF
jgi:aryl-alcohol dehydrogenase-like predicted oxidoreductase